MDYEIQAGLRAVSKAVERRTKAGSKRKETVDYLRELDEEVCLTSRTLFMRFLETAVWCRSVDQATYDAVKEALEMAAACLPTYDYPPHSKTPYKVKVSVAARVRELKKRAKDMVDDDTRPGWLVVPIQEDKDVLQSA